MAMLLRVRQGLLGKLRSYDLRPEPPQVPQVLAVAAPRPPMPTVPVPLQVGQTFFAATAASCRFSSGDLNNLTTTHFFCCWMGVAGKLPGETLLASNIAMMARLERSASPSLVGTTGFDTRITHLR